MKCFLKKNRREQELLWECGSAQLWAAPLLPRVFFRFCIHWQCWFPPIYQLQKLCVQTQAQYVRIHANAHTTYDCTRVTDNGQGVHLQELTKARRTALESTETSGSGIVLHSPTQRKPPIQYVPECLCFKRPVSQVWQVTGDEEGARRGAKCKC